MRLCGFCSSRPTTWGASHSGWPRRLHGCARPAPTWPASISTRDRCSDDQIRSAEVVGFFLPMHTATRLAVPVIDRVRAVNPAARLIAYGLYAPLNDDPAARARRARSCSAASSKQDLVDRRQRVSRFDAGLTACALRGDVPRLQFRVPVARGLPPLTRYATLQVTANGGPSATPRRAAAASTAAGTARSCRSTTAASGSSPPDVVLADVRAQVAAGAQAHHVRRSGLLQRHPARRGRRARLRRRDFPGVTYDVTIKVEHLLQHADMLPRAAATPAARS